MAVTDMTAQGGSATGVGGAQVVPVGIQTGQTTDHALLDPSTEALNKQLQDKGFLVTSTEDIINWARTGSLHWMTFGLACCAIEMIHASMPRYDL